MNFFQVGRAAPAVILVVGVCSHAADRIAPPQSEIAVSSGVREALTERLKELAVEIERTREAMAEKAELLELLPDVLILQKAVDWALRYDEFYSTNEFAVANELLDLGLERARQLQAGNAPWTEATGLVVRGYQSRVDATVQPYGLIVPDGWRKGAAQRYRLDVWLHGRDEKLTELKFINQRRRLRGEFAPADAFVLHPYGRYCNAFKFAGETDVFEALGAVQQHYPIDDARIALRGFSMGGAGVWHLAAHHPGEWVVAAPGAGFAESAEYLGKLTRGPKPAAWEQTLWGLYDAPDYAPNFFNLPVLSYDGELDKQKQAAEVMAAAMLRDGMQLHRVTGKGAGHQYTPAARAEINERVDAIVRAGKPQVPRRVKFETRTLRYARSHWVQVEGMEQHWKPARIEAEIAGPTDIILSTTNVTAVSLHFGPGQSPMLPGARVVVRIDGAALSMAGPRSDLSLTASFHREGGVWKTGVPAGDRLRKRPGLSGPVDDAFFDSFVMVPPAGPGFHETTDAWAKRELEWMQVNWRGLFRGDAPVKAAADITGEEIANQHLVLWGDPQSNTLIRRMLDRLPVEWNAETVKLGGQLFAADRHVPVLVFPNPFNPAKYVVLNSGFTFRAFGSNADQTPKLPDFAIVEVKQPATAIAPGGVVTAGFFDENWELPKNPLP